MTAIVLRPLLLLVLAAVLVLAAEDVQQSPASGVRIDQEFESLDVSRVSRWKYEVQKWPDEVKCVGFWRRLNADITDDALTTQQLTDVDETAKMTARADASLLRRLSIRLHRRNRGHSLNQLINFVDTCAKLLEKDEGHSEVSEAPAVTPLEVERDALSKQSEELARALREAQEEMVANKLRAEESERKLVASKALQKKLLKEKRDAEQELVMRTWQMRGYGSY